jgi:hypothetical protein
LTGSLGTPNKYVSTFRRVGFILSLEWPDFCRVVAGFTVHNRHSGTACHTRRWANVMDSNNSMFGIVIGAIVVAVAAIFILSGGEFGGKKTVDGDQDLPPVATETR